MKRQRIKKFTIEACSNTNRHIKIKAKQISKEILVNDFNMFNPQIRVL